MQYVYDAQKRKTNLAKHGYDFDDAALVIESAQTVTFEDRRFDCGEQRFLSFGRVAR